MNVPTIPGQVYVVTSSADCTVTCDINGITYTLCTASAGQATFCAPSDTVTLSDATAIVTPTFKGAATAALGGGKSITVDQTYSATSENAQSGVAVNSAFEKKGVKTSQYIAALGTNTTPGYWSAQVGSWSKAGSSSVAVGYGADASTLYTQAFGRYAVNKDSGTAVMRCQTRDNGIITNFYVIGANSGLANTYEGGEACLGYVVKDSEGNILACGTRKLSELLTNNTAFTPTMLDLDSPAPTPFLPTGIMEPDPLVDPEEFEN